MRPRVLLPLVLFVVALCVRCIGLQWGLPSSERWYSYHPDEFQIFAAIANLNFFASDFNPDFFNYPSLFIYLSYLAHVLGSGFGFSSAPSNDPSQMALFMRDVLMSSRFVAALLGAATVPLVFSIARQIGGDKVGILAALLLAFAPGHVQHSHFATADVPATFFITLSLWLSTRALRDNKETRWHNRQLCIAAFAAGLAAATKYNAALVLIAPLAVWFFLRKQNAASRALPLGLIALCTLGFLIGCPFSVLDFTSFWGDKVNSGFYYELFVHPRQGHGEVFLQTGIGWVYHLVSNAPFLLTLPLLLGVLFGMASTRAVKDRVAARREITILLIWCALYFFALGFSQVRFMRYLLPLVPALCIFAAMGVLALRGRKIKIAASASLILIAAWGARDVLYPFIVPDPRDQAAEFMASNVSPPTTVGMISPPWFWSPPLSPLDAPPFRPLSPEQLFKASGEQYKFVFTGFDSKKLQQEKPQWFVMSEFEWREKERLNDAHYKAFSQAMKRDYSLARRFKNAAPLALPGRNFVPHDFLYTNPEIRIYERR